VPHARPNVTLSKVQRSSRPNQLLGEVGAYLSLTLLEDL
jgi:hypothetical protein